MMYSVHSRDGIASEKGIIACGDDEELQKFKRKYLLFYGFGEDNDFQARNIQKRTDGTILMYSFVIRTMTRSKLQDTAITAY